MHTLDINTFFRRHPVATYFGAVFLLSWGSGLVLLGPELARGEAIPPTDALLLFPVLVVGVGVLGILWTGIVEGKCSCCGCTRTSTTYGGMKDGT